MLVDYVKLEMEKKVKCKSLPPCLARKKIYLSTVLYASVRQYLEGLTWLSLRMDYMCT